MASLLVFLLLLGSTSAVSRAQAPPPPGAPAPAAAGAPDAIGATPPRLAYAQGPVSFWRPGAPDWAPAQVNTPLAPGDELYTGHEGLAELQVGGRAFVRAWGDTQIGLANQEPDFLQLKVTAGHATLDLRGVDAGRTVEIDTPHAAFSIESSGNYRVDVTPERTLFTTRRGGRAGVTPAGGQPVAISASEQIVVEGAPAPSVRSFAAPDLDVFDRWNYSRTDALLESASARYVPNQVYGVDDLDHYGSWRTVQTYGSVWVPQGVPVGWAPYSTGRWIWDPFYGWTWVDTAPWGWAPYHYGRWVFVDGYWGWTPGPLVARPVYAPALVVFFSAPGVSVSIGSPFVSWVALGWGEPVVPWWGRPGYVGQPHWVGWGGPRVVNNVVVNNTTVVNVTNINVYRNTTVNNAVVAVQRDGFGRRGVQEARVEQVDVRQLKPVRGRLDVKPEPVSLVAHGGAAAVRPPDAVMERPVVATRPQPRRGPEALPPALRTGPVSAAPAVKVPEPKIVPAPKAAQTAPVPARPPLGASDVEKPRRPEPQRLETSPRPQGGAAIATPPGEDKTRRPEVSTPSSEDKTRRPDQAPPAQRRPETPPRPETPGAGERGPERAAPPGRGPAVGAPPAVVTPPPRPELAPPVARPPQPQHEQGRDKDRPLPGEPANKVFPGRSEIAPRHPQAVPAVSQHATTPTPQRGAFSPDAHVGRGHAADKPTAPAPRPAAASPDDEHEARKGPRR
jgi:hypothetical protein